MFVTLTPGSWPRYPSWRSFKSSGAEDSIFFNARNGRLDDNLNRKKTFIFRHLRLDKISCSVFPTQVFGPAYYLRKRP
jgi:hypothetical protein